MQEYQDGESRTIGGVTYTRQGGQWIAGAGAPTGPVYGAPKPQPEPSAPSGFEFAGPHKLRPIAGGPSDPANSDETFDPATTQFYAGQVLAGGPMPAFGMGKAGAANRRQVMEAVARMAGASGTTGADLATQVAHYQAGKKQISTLENQYGTTQQNEKTALANGQQFMDRSTELPGQGGGSFLNSVVQGIQRHVPFVPGHETVAAMDAAYNTFVNEYAKVVAGAPSGSGTLSDSARHEAMQTMQSNADPSQKQAAFDQMKTDMENRLHAMQSTISDAYGNLTKQPGQAGAPPVDQQGIDAFNKGMNDIVGNRRLSPDDRLKAALAFADQSHRGVDPKQIIAAIAAGHGNVVEDPNFTPPGAPPGGGGGGQSIPAQLGESTANVLSGVVQGAAALPDMAANALGATLALPADALGFSNVARDLRNPITIGGLVEHANPTPKDAIGSGVRTVAQLGGGVAGFPESASNAVTKAIVGQVPRQLPNALARGGNAVMRAADDLGASVGSKVQPLAADVSGPTIRRITSVGAQLPLSASPIVRAAQRLTTQTQGARDTIARRAGEIVEPEMAGEAAKRGLGFYRTRTGQQAKTMYQAAEKASEGVQIEPTSVLKAIEGHIAEQKAIPGGSDILPVLENLAQSLSKSGSFSIAGVRGMRTVLNARLTNAGLTPTNAQRIVNDLVHAAGDDITTSLLKAGKTDAAKAYRSADKFYAERMDVINNAIKPIIGKNGEKSGEQVLQAIQQAAKGNAGRLTQIMRVLPAEDAGTVRATVISQLGKSSAGTQNAEGSAFSLGQFLTHWNQMTPRARSILFDRETLTDLNNLATVANGSKQAARYANSSNTGGVVGALATAGTFTTDFMTVAATALGQIGGGMLLAAPGFARWMAKAPSNPRALSAHVARLSTIAAQSPAMASEIKAFGEALLRGANDNVGRAGSLAAQSPDPRVKQQN